VTKTDERNKWKGDGCVDHGAMPHPRGSEIRVHGPSDETSTILKFAATKRANKKLSPWDTIQIMNGFELAL
jgi:hypothetical protein